MKVGCKIVAINFVSGLNRSNYGRQSIDFLRPPKNLPTHDSSNRSSSTVVWPTYFKIFSFDIPHKPNFIKSNLSPNMMFLTEVNSKVLKVMSFNRLKNSMRSWFCLVRRKLSTSFSCDSFSTRMTQKSTFWKPCGPLNLTLDENMSSWATFSPRDRPRISAQVIKTQLKAQKANILGLVKQIIVHLKLSYYYFLPSSWNWVGAL